MIRAHMRTLGDALAVAALLLGAAPHARLDAQAAVISMPKQAAQRAAAASNAQLQAQVGQTQNAQAPGGQGASRQSAHQSAAPATGVVQTGAPSAAATAGADPGARPAGAAATPAPDPSNAIMREVFEYTSAGRRDPFFSLMATGDIRPMLSDLRLTTILYDLSGRRPVAVMNDVTSNLQYRVTTGMMLGRMRVTQIKPRAVIFAIEEFGFSRADSILLTDKPQTRK